MTDIGPIKVGKNVKAQLENDLVLELDAVKHLNVAIRTPLRPATTPLARCLKRFSPTKKNTSIIWRASCTRSAR